MTPEAQLAALRDLARGLLFKLRVLGECDRLECSACRASIGEAVELGEATLEEIGQ